MPLLNLGFTPNQAQKRAIEHPPAPLMILAGAGTGKTWTLIQRLVYYITELNIPADTILTITYTEKAAQELSARILDKIGSRAAGITVSTFHAFCFNIVKKFGYKNKKIPRLMEDGDAVYLLLNHFDSFGPFDSKEFPMDPVSSVIKSFIPFFNRIRDEIIDLSAWDNPREDGIFTSETISQLNDLRRIFPIFQMLKRKQNRVDYGDMISKCHEIIKTDPGILSDLTLKYGHIIIDEFQDNNFALNEVIGLIADKHGSITVVGDDDQIIYTFRGASAYNINEFRSRYKRFKDYKEISLEENFRSHFQILKAANEIIAKNRERVHKILKPFKNRSGPLPELIWGNKNAQHEFIVEKIQELGESGSYAYHDMAVLCRTRNQVKDLAGTLKNAHIPVTAYLIEYFQIPLIRDLMSWCHLIADSGLADSALHRILGHFLDGRSLWTLFSGFHKRDPESRLNLILKHIELYSLDLQDQLRLPLKLINTLKAENIKKNGADMVWSICEKTKLIRPYLENYELNDQTAIINAAKFMEKSQNFSKSHEEDPSLKAFVKYMDTLQNAGSMQTIYPVFSHRRGGVLVQTIHGVKGAEFPIVFIPHNQAGSFPLNFNTGKLLTGPPDSWLPYHNATTLSAKEGHTQEERRLLYVALTRAKERLFILAPKKRTSKFIKYDLPPRFIKEITMESKLQPREPHTHADIRQKYEARLNNALSTDQFEIAKNMLLRLERLSEIEKKGNLTWGESSWEHEMQTELKGKFTPDRSNQLFLSASSLDTYHQCPLKYRLANVDKIPEKTEKPQLIFGNIIHKVLEQFHAEDSEESEKYLVKLLEENWDSKDFDYSSREENFKQQGLDLLHRYYEYIKTNPPRIAAREYSFSFKIEEITIKGKIDRIDYGQKGFGVIDYKTGKNPTLPKNSLQLAIYSIFLQQDDQEFGGRPEFGGLFFLREINDPLKLHSFTEEELETVRSQIIDTGQKIQNGEYPAKKGFHCSFCDFKSLLCPAWEQA